MSDPYIKVYCSKETKTIFDSFYEQNKGIFGTKANMFRVMVSNLPVLANQSNVKLSNPESKGIEQKNQEKVAQTLPYLSLVFQAEQLYFHQPFFQFPHFHFQKIVKLI